ncbi:MAG: glycosyltransferase [Dehalococcoidales bacterium]|nr:glycosyltransferase [Dehalococcoidales bacterium]
MSSKGNRERIVRLSDLKIVEVGVLAGGPETLLAHYLRERAGSFTFIESLHTRYYQPGMDLIHVTSYRKGKLVKSFNAGAGWGFLLKYGKLRRTLLYFLTMSGILMAVLRLRTRYDLFIAVDSPYPFSGLVLRRLGLVKKVFSIIGDHFPLEQRKKLSVFFSWFYGYADKLAQNTSQAVWYFTQQLIDINREEHIITNENIPRLVIPIGIDMKNVKNVPDSALERASIGYIGRLNDEIGMEMVIGAMADIAGTVPDIRLKIIGSGDNEQKLKVLAEKKGLKDNVVFYGFMSERDKAKEILAKCAVCIAPYVPGVAYSIQYTDPAKVKEYIECGTPVIMTKVPELAAEIQDKRAGFAVEYTRAEMAEAMLKLLTDDALWHEYRLNISKLADRFDYIKLHDEAFPASGIEI